MKLISYDNQGTDGDNPALVVAIYELDGQQVRIPANTPANQIEASVIAALAAVDSPRPARVAYNALVDNNQDLLVYCDYFLRAERDLIALWKTMPNLTDTTTAVYAAVRQDRVNDAHHAAMYNRFLWYVQRTTAITLVQGDLPPTPTAAQAQTINAAAYQFVGQGVMICNMLIRG